MRGIDSFKTPPQLNDSPPFPRSCCRWCPTSRYRPDTSKPADPAPLTLGQFKAILKGIGFECTIVDCEWEGTMYGVVPVEGNATERFGVFQILGQADHTPVPINICRSVLNQLGIALEDL